jgi:peptidyl-prolyl cis-trans isomerase SurA
MTLSPLAPFTIAARTVAFLAALTAAVAGVACGSTPGTPAQVSADTWAVVDGREITRETVERAYRRVAQSQAPSEEEAMTAKLSLLNEMIVQEILLARAQALKIEVTDAELDAAYAERKKNIPEENFKKELESRNLTEADMRDGLRRELIADKVIAQEVTSKILVTEQEIQDFFNANRAQFNLAENAYHIAQIVVTPVRDAENANRMRDDALTPEAAERKANAMMERLKAGAPFAELARDYSEDPQTAPQGGDLGFVPVSALAKAPAPLRDAVLKSAPGTVTKVSSGGGHTLVLVVAKENAGQRDLNMPAVRDGITNTLKGRREQLLRTAYLTAARADASVVNYLARNLVAAQGKASPTLAPSGPGK